MLISVWSEYGHKKSVEPDRCRSTFRGLRIAQCVRMTTQKPTPIQEHTKPAMWLNDILIPVAIYRCTVLNTFLKVAKFLNARTERQINAFNMSVRPPHHYEILRIRSV